jgi:hypothetical protein
MTMIGLKKKSWQLGKKNLEWRNWIKKTGKIDLSQSEVVW